MATAPANPFDPTALADGTSTLTMRDSALGLSTDLVQAGVVFNDATRLLEGGLWSKPADSNNQQNYASMYTTDIHAVLSDISAVLTNPATTTVGGVAYTPSANDIATLTEIQGQLQTLLTEAPNAAGHSAAAVHAQQSLHDTQLGIISEIANNPSLSAALSQVSYASGTGANNVGFQALPTGADDHAALAAATAQGATLGDIGQVFNAASDLAVGGLNRSNLHEFNNDMKAISQGLTQIVNNPAQLAQIESGESAQDAALTTVHLDTVLNQVNQQISRFDPMYATNPNVAARSTNDNVLDMIDIIQNDAALNAAAGGNGTPATASGFGEMPAYLNGAEGINGKGGTILQFQDNQAQTNFWAAFLAEGNTINNQLQAVAAGQETPAQINQLITAIQNYNNFAAQFDKAQGGVFGARFDNELLGGTLLADTNNAIHGLTGIANGDTGAALAADQAQIVAAGQGFVADAADVSGNNIPLGGGTFVDTATTVATATSPNGLAMGTIPVTANPDIANGTGSGGGGRGHNGGTYSSADAGADGIGHYHHFVHMWHG
jgi:trimeric autotransporter adhesin